MCGGLTFLYVAAKSIIYRLLFLSMFVSLFTHNKFFCHITSQIFESFQKLEVVLPSFCVKYPYHVILAFEDLVSDSKKMAIELIDSHGSFGGFPKKSVRPFPDRIPPPGGEGHFR